MTSVALPALAKINLDLRVLGMRADGYHELRSIFQSLALSDTVTVSLRRGPMKVTCDDPEIPTDERNLVWKAASLLQRLGKRRGGEPRDLAIHIRKRIPSEAGLGGGSADAAATLIALTRLWNLDLDPPTLSRLAARLGADVPFFLIGGTALGLGRGDDIYPLVDMPTAHVVVIKPGFGVSTAEAYDWFDHEGPRRKREPPQRPTPTGWPAWAATLRNDLEAPVVRHHPAIGRLRQALIDAGALTASMSGSGSAVFGLFERAEAARRTARDLARPGWTVVCTRTVSRREYAGRWRLRASGRARGLAKDGL